MCIRDRTSPADCKKARCIGAALGHHRPSPRGRIPHGRHGPLTPARLVAPGAPPRPAHSHLSPRHTRP
eukprot:97842-Prorocentrum_lima.AAC.1